MVSNQLATLCVCSSNLTYNDCCGVYHRGEKLPATAEQLMRSRFTAYAMANAEYLLSTWDAHTRPLKIDLSDDATQWLRLEIVLTKKGTAKDDKGVVEFKGYYQTDDGEAILHEISRFKKTANRWFYLDGKVKSVSKPNQTQNLGKNALCSCGSGKKFKRCCGQE